MQVKNARLKFTLELPWLTTKHHWKYTLKSKCAHLVCAYGISKLLKRPDPP